jgi:hypothetical protein
MLRSESPPKINSNDILILLRNNNSMSMIRSVERTLDFGVELVNSCLGEGGNSTVHKGQEGETA